MPLIKFNGFTYDRQIFKTMNSIDPEILKRVIDTYDTYEKKYNTYAEPITSTTIANFFKAGYELVTCSLFGKHFAGCAFYLKDKSVLTIVGPFVDPKYVSKSAGSFLLTQLESHAKVVGAKWITNTIYEKDSGGSDRLKRNEYMPYTHYMRKVIK